MSGFATKQEAAWAGEFGDAYNERNASPEWIARNLAFFSPIVKRCGRIASVLELGANIGRNLVALHQLLPAAQLSGVEINASAAATLRNLGYVQVFQDSLLTFSASEQWDLVFTKGVLIHVDPNSLAAAYERLYKFSRRYICVAEYYNPSPVEVNYRGHTGLLFKRDFAGDLLERYRELRLVDYGFVYRRDPHFPQDDLCWFLLEKMPG